MAKKTNLGSDFGPNLVPTFFFMGFITSSRYYTLLQAITVWNLKENLWTKLEKIAKKPSFGPDFGPFGHNSSYQIFFSKTWLCQSLDIMVSYDHVQYHNKMMIQSWENLVTDEWTDRRTKEPIERQTARLTRVIS